MTTEEGALREMIRLQLNNALNDGEFNVERLRRIEAAARGAAELLAALHPPRVSGKPMTWAEDQAENERAAESLARLALVHGVGEDDDEDEVEEAAAPVVPPFPSVFLAVGLVRRICDVLVDSDGDVFDQLDELLHACGVNENTADDAMVPVDFGLVTMAGIGLCDEKTIVAHPTTALAVEAELKNAVSSIAFDPALDGAYKQPESEAR